ncbi:MAG: hypothetical protein GX096_01115 [Clostridiales bacterium]|nr:hypothetical protein [Clostridiales bacterium]
MDLLRTILIYMSMIFMTSVQNAPDPAAFVTEPVATPTAIIQVTESPAPAATATPKPTPVPTIDITSTTAYKTLSVGDKGENVSNMQQKLAEYGYYEGEIDGSFGNQTRQAVEKFQYNHGLSVDGFAGKNTLTVLYESDEVRPLVAEATESPAPSQTPEDQLQIAATEPVIEVTQEPTIEPSAEPSVEPSEKPQAIEPTQSEVQPASDETDESEIAATIEPTQTPVPEFLEMEGYAVTIADSKDPIMTQKTEEHEAKAIPPYLHGEMVYLPLLEILEQSSIPVVVSKSIDIDQYAFALGDDIYLITALTNKEGEPVSPEGYKNNEAVPLAFTDIKAVDDILYLPLEEIQNFANIIFELDDENKTITATYPAAEELE